MVKELAFFVIILLLAVTPATLKAQSPNDALTIAISNDLQPFTFVNAEGKPAGIFVDIWRLWGEKPARRSNLSFPTGKPPWKTSKTAKLIFIRD
jgi:hypothetical protein